MTQKERLKEHYFKTIDHTDAIRTSVLSAIEQSRDGDMVEAMRTLREILDALHGIDVEAQYLGELLLEDDK